MFENAQKALLQQYAQELFPFAVQDAQKKIQQKLQHLLNEEIHAEQDYGALEEWWITGLKTEVLGADHNTVQWGVLSKGWGAPEKEKLKTLVTVPQTRLKKCRKREGRSVLRKNVSAALP